MGMIFGDSWQECVICGDPGYHKHTTEEWDQYHRHCAEWKAEYYRAYAARCASPDYRPTETTTGALDAIVAAEVAKARGNP